MDINTQIESYKLWNIVKLCVRETLEHNSIIARKLPKGVAKNELRFQSTNPKWLNSTEELLSHPFIDYTSISAEGPIIIKAEIISHLINVGEEKSVPSALNLKDKVVLNYDFKKWLVRTEHSFPKFLYSSNLKANNQLHTDILQCWRSANFR